MSSSFTTSHAFPRHDHSPYGLTSVTVFHLNFSFFVHFLSSSAKVSFVFQVESGVGQKTRESP
uniref:Uncharacterized protein n=1 Tax=Anguilla anguilla TaxID=7936 RepID=A0A0E9WS43_ANGAN